jgi:colicin import membrane protein
MEMPNDTRDRILTAANILFAETGRGSFPTVDAVRRTAKVSMSDASTAMKAWRKAQLAQSVPSTAPVPDAIEQLQHQALVRLWQAAQ